MSSFYKRIQTNFAVGQVISNELEDNIFMLYIFMAGSN